MSDHLAPQYEAFIEDALATGKYASRKELIEAAVDSLRERVQVPMVPEEHMELVEEGLADIEAGRVSEMTDADWERLRQIARDAAARQRTA